MTATEFNSFSSWRWNTLLHTTSKYFMDLNKYHRTPHTWPINYGKIMQQSLLMYTQCWSRHNSHCKSPYWRIFLMKTYAIKPSRSSWDLNKTFLNTIYFQIHLSKNSSIQTIYTTTHFVYTSSVEERPKVVFPTAINVSDSIFQELQNFIYLNEDSISV